eukprot:TRINITY_DN12475_c0_g6_i1.p1 TRINITY_DN12475_c0_g6~~TRINITY_DN12475_c0_g6_i1.p1  ORF type:complete len:585 (+),score=146.11 TRINITY_DN12475_c0_g6_i1:2129-3883(+)
MSLPAPNVEQSRGAKLALTATLKSTGPIIRRQTASDRSSQATSAINPSWTQSEENPFKLPTDGNLFKARDEAKQQQKERRQQIRALKVHERAKVLQRPPTKSLTADIDAEEEEEEARRAGEIEPIVKDELEQQLDELAIQTRDRRVEQEQLSEYVGTRRELFLLKYSLNVKREEIRKLEDKAREEEARLEEAERWLEADAAKFDKFLRENDRAAVAAIKAAEDATRRKQEKAQEIKRLQAEIMALGSEVTKQDDVIAELRSYRLFLEELAPSEWAQEQRSKQDKFLKESGKAGSSTLDVPLSSGAGRLRLRRRSSFGSKPRRRSSSFGPRVPLSLADTEEQIERLNLLGEVDEDLEPELYFHNPQQLIDILEQLEEENLSLITNGQDTEEQLQDLIDRTQAEKRALITEASALETQIAEFEAAIAQEHKTVEVLKERCRFFSAADVDDQEDEIEKFDQKVEDVYRDCIGQNEAGISTLQMLTNIENKVEELFEAMQKMPPDQLEHAEKTKDKERRLRLREEKLQKQKQLQDERVQRALARAQEAPKKVAGRKLMYRSQPPEKKKHVAKARRLSAEEEELKYFFQ